MLHNLRKFCNLDLSLNLLSPGQFLGLGDGCGQKLGFKGWLGSISDLLLRALSSDLLGGQLLLNSSLALGNLWLDGLLLLDGCLLLILQQLLDIDGLGHDRLPCCFFVAVQLPR